MVKAVNMLQLAPHVVYYVLMPIMLPHPLIKLETRTLSAALYNKLLFQLKTWNF